MEGSPLPERGVALSLRGCSRTNLTGTGRVSNESMLFVITPDISKHADWLVEPVSGSTLLAVSPKFLVSRRKGCLNPRRIQGSRSSAPFGRTIRTD